MHRALSIALASSALALALFGCSTNPQGSSTTTLTAPQTASGASTVPTLPPASDFVSGLSNPYLGFFRGRAFHYRAETADGTEETVVEVTNQTKTIIGVTTTIVHDQVSLDGSVIEDTFDYYAQDKDGNVWYFGEDSKELDHGTVISTQGSWLAGENGAQPGIVMLADLKVGTKYQQEFAPGVGEDMAQVKSLTETVSVPYGSFDNCLQTLEWNPLERGPKENKYYASGVGLVLETGSGGERDELISVGR